MTNLSRFQVKNLHGRLTWNANISDNRLILVGENGAGKSTFVSLVYYFLTRQWHRIRDYRFERIEAVLNEHTLTVTPEMIDSLKGHRQQIRRFPMAVRRSLDRYFLAGNPSDTTILTVRNRLADELRIPREVALDFVRDYVEANEQSPELNNINEIISSEITDQILFLPTYRRIEQDLKSIFPGFDSEIRSIRDRLNTAQTGKTFIELVEFGMEDVEHTIQIRMDQIKESVRTGLSNLTGTYLRDVIRGVHQMDAAVLRTIDLETLDVIFSRIGDEILPPADKQLLVRRIGEMTGRDTLETEDIPVAHFLLKLFDLYKEQLANERDVRQFAEVCNIYLSGKVLVYDNTHYGLSIRQSTDGPDDGSRVNTEALQFRMLSSGEKQIVSLFSHIYLSGKQGFFVIIDEPELSLSVPWQHRFLPDIIKTGVCNGLIAVTHSPFIWKNELRQYAHSLGEFLEVRDDVVH